MKSTLVYNNLHKIVIKLITLLWIRQWIWLLWYHRLVLSLRVHSLWPYLNKLLCFSFFCFGGSLEWLNSLIVSLITINLITLFEQFWVLDWVSIINWEILHWNVNSSALEEYQSGKWKWKRGIEVKDVETT